MTDWIAEYVKVVRHPFPIMGRPEKAYLEHFSDHISECFEAQPPDSMDAIISQCGTPEDAVRGYLDATEPEYLITRIKNSRRWRRLAICSLVILLIAVVIFARLLWLEYSNYLNAIDDAFGYIIETME